MYQTLDISQLLRRVLWINAQLTIVWSLKHHSTQPIYIFSRLRVLHLDRLKEGTWLHSFVHTWLCTALHGINCKSSSLFAKVQYLDWPNSRLCCMKLHSFVHSRHHWRKKETNFWYLPLGWANQKSRFSNLFCQWSRTCSMLLIIKGHPR